MMIQKFLRAKHWQLFLLTYGLPLLFQIIMLALIFSGWQPAGEPRHLSPWIAPHFTGTIALSFITVAVLCGWFWSIGVGLQGKLPEDLRMRTGKFKIAFLVMTLCALLFFGIFYIVVIGILPVSRILISTTSFLIFGMYYIFSGLCALYCLYFVSKTIKTAELQREVSFGDFIGEFFLIWFFFIGVWIVQPRVNALVEDV